MHKKPHSPEARAKIAAAKRGVPVLAKRRQPRVVEGVEEWQCPTCSRWFEREGFYRSRKTWNGITSQCRQCHTAGNLRTRDENRKRESNRSSMARARTRDHEKFARRDREAARKREWDDRREARYQLNLAIARGEVLRPRRCTECGEQRRVHAHHSDYSKPLGVEWLCTVCHGKRHRKR